MTQQIITIGTSAGITLSLADMKALGLSVGDPVKVTARQGVLEIRAASKYAHLSHEELMALVDARFGR
ncbi:hypothetical protein AB1046_00735 [Promicromonospora sp. Populi]|uniref:AbrB/MazE/SpoVT family DNA-binding domain-containing protein n=1 Tax=Promicromonospora sp. Populi TaxID=3239420 RepID=UPI0034E230EF